MLPPAHPDNFRERNEDNIVMPYDNLKTIYI